MNQFIHVTYLTVALMSLVTYAHALKNLRAAPPAEKLASHGLMRTALSRVGVGVMYSVIGVLLVTWAAAPLWLTLVGYITAAVVWIVNSRLDVRLKRRLDMKGTP